MSTHKKHIVICDICGVTINKYRLSIHTEKVHPDVVLKEKNAKAKEAKKLEQKITEPLKKKRKKKSNRGNSVWTISGGGVETNRRRH